MLTQWVKWFGIKILGIFELLSSIDPLMKISFIVMFFFSKFWKYTLIWPVLLFHSTFFMLNPIPKGPNSGSCISRNATPRTKINKIAKAANLK